MNAVTAFFVDHMDFVFFCYGLAFFAMGLALALADRRSSQLRFAAAMLPLAAFGFLHAAHEWFEMFQRSNVAPGGALLGIGAELVRVALLVSSFIMLLAFGVILVAPEHTSRRRIYAPMALLVLLWIAGTALVVWIFAPSPRQDLLVADGMARYALGIPAAIIGAWALMRQQRAFREQDLPQFGRDLVWTAAALLLYGAVGQLFVRRSELPLSWVLNTDNFLAWFGLPVQVFRALLAIVMTIFLVRALRAFDLENRRRLDQANTARLTAQSAALDAERRVSRETEHLNQELRLAAHKLSLLLDISNILTGPASLDSRLRQVLDQVVEALTFCNAGLIMLKPPGQPEAAVSAMAGFDGGASQTAADEELHAQAVELGVSSVAGAMVLCRHADGEILDFYIDSDAGRARCHQYPSPTTMIALPVMASSSVIGSLVLVRRSIYARPVTTAEWSLMVGIAQQLGFSMENALLNQQAQAREQVLGELLHQVVGAQEAERQRIARELHDATGQSLTAVAMGLSGLENRLNHLPAGHEGRAAADQVRELKSFSTNALGELRTIISDLRPPQLDDLGLAAALRWYIDAYQKRRGMAATLTVTGDETTLPTEFRTVLFRITQEALTNTAKHADAARVDVQLDLLPTQVHLTICDDGRGFDPQLLKQIETQQVAGWGLVGIRERALLLGGSFEIKTAPGAGTLLSIQVPLPAPARTPA